MTRILIAAILVALFQTNLHAAPPQCINDHAVLVTLASEAFDQDPQGGWRVIAAKQGCTEAAADLISDYRKERWHDLKPAQVNNLYWHEGQLRAYLGQTQRAVGLMMAGVDPSAEDFSFQEYALGTIAFLNRDKVGLESARTRLAALPEPPEFTAQTAELKQKYGVTIHWPKNLDVLDRLLACFDRGYQEAYKGCSVGASKR